MLRADSITRHRIKTKQACVHGQPNKHRSESRGGSPGKHVELCVAREPRGRWSVRRAHVEVSGTPYHRQQALLSPHPRLDEIRLMKVSSSRGGRRCKACKTHARQNKPSRPSHPGGCCNFADGPSYFCIFRLSPGHPARLALYTTTDKRPNYHQKHKRQKINSKTRNRCSKLQSDTAPGGRNCHDLQR